MTGLLRGAHDLADEGLRTLGAAVAVTNAAWADVDVVVVGAHGRKAGRKGQRRRSGY